MKNYLVRGVRLKDSYDVALLVTQLGYPTSADEMRTRLNLLINKSHYKILVVEISKIVVGIIGADIGYPIGFTGSYGRIVFLAVDEKWRRKGIGKMLIIKTETWIKKQGAVRVVLTSGNHRINAHHFYKANGYSKTGIRFEKELI